MAFKGQTDSTTTPRTPESNRRSQPGPTGPQAVRRQGGSRRVGAIAAKPSLSPAYDVPNTGTLRDQLRRTATGPSESGTA